VTCLAAAEGLLPSQSSCRGQRATTSKRKVPGTVFTRCQNGLDFATTFPNDVLHLLEPGQFGRWGAG
jgi:hypothetical protein